MCEEGAGGLINPNWNTFENNHRVRLDIKSNGLPNHCFDSPEVPAIPQWIDFSVYWQPPKPFSGKYSIIDE